MRVRMSALRRCHVPSYNYEFGKGEEFEAVDEREATRLERRRLAVRVAATKPAEPAAPQGSSEGLFTTSVAADGAPAAVADGDVAGSRKGRGYKRRDMQAEG